MSNTRPLQFIDYRCGHSTPVGGTGAIVNRDCPACVKALGCLAGLRAAAAAHEFSYEHIAECELCATLIP